MGRTGNIQPVLDLDEHIEVTGFSGKKVMPYMINPDGSADLQENPDKAFQVDDYTTASVTYLGWATVGSATSDSVWKITKFDETTGVIQTWADSNTDYDNEWDNRDSLTYG